MADQEHPAGTPIWADLASPDVPASARFYGELLGWTAEVSPEPEAGGYTMFFAGGKRVAGAAPIMNPGQHPAWTTYIKVDDADAVVARAQANGGQAPMEPMDVMDQGRLAILFDPTGAAIGLWQPREHRGADVYNVPGAMCWNELITRDVEAAKRFYTAVFDWEAETSGEGAEAYTQWKVGGRPVGGMMQTPAMVPADVPNYWAVYFAVNDYADIVKRAPELGASVMMPGMTIPFGTFAVLADPNGAVFAVIQLNG